MGQRTFALGITISLGFASACGASSGDAIATDGGVTRTEDGASGPPASGDAGWRTAGLNCASWSLDPQSSSSMTTWTT